MNDPQTPQGDLEDLTDLARRFIAREQLDEAADLYLLALRLDPKSLAVKMGLADVRKLQRQQRGRPQRGLRDLMREQFRRNAIDAGHFLGLAHLYAEKGENARAFECLEIGKAKDLANPSHHKLHGRVLFRRKEFDEAAEEFARALRLNPFDRETAESLGRAEFERKQFEAALRASVHAFLLLHDADGEGTERLKRRIQTLKQILGWGNRELTAAFHERQEHLRTAFDRLEWHRERFLEEGGLPRISTLFSLPARKQTGGQIELAGRLRRQRALSHLSDEQIFRLTKTVEEEVHETGSLIVAHRSQGRDLYLLERGAVVLQRPTGYGTFLLGKLDSGELFGESSFITHHERSADAVAAQPCQLFRFDGAALEQLVDDAPELGAQLYFALWHALARKLRVTNETLKTFFSAETAPENFLRLRRKQSGAAAAVTVEASDKVRLFREQGLSRRELMTLATFSKEKRFADGAYLFQEGDKGAEMYVVLEGRALISKYIPGAGEEALAILERGDFFGEMSLIDGQPRSADARAHAGPLTVLALDQATVREVLAMDPHASLEFLQLLCRLVANRLREIDEKVVGWRILSGERNDESISA
jgi:CRP-like cAMP-binding protein/cytochrome c-type biogenesis protein CcmH/NrfG